MALLVLSLGLMASSYIIIFGRPTTNFAAAVAFTPLSPPRIVVSSSSSAVSLPSVFAKANWKSVLQVHNLVVPHSSVSSNRRGSFFRLMSSVSSPPTKWSDIASDTSYASYANNLFPPLTSTSHKGSHGRIAIFGGSEKYTGAPYYAAQSALNCGVDLVTIFCAKEAATPIKCYSPELMVQSVYSVEELDILLKEEHVLLDELEEWKQSNELMDEEVNTEEITQLMEKLEYTNEKQQLIIQSELKKNERSDKKMEELVERLKKIKSLEEKLQHIRSKQDVAVNDTVDTISSMLPTLHTLCIGPGMGRHPLVFCAVQRVLQKAMEVNLTIVLDADVLFMLSLNKYKSLFGELLDYERCVMTPNVMELRRLNDALDIATIATEVKNSNIIVQKGHTDTIANKHHTMHCEEEGGLKRSGGIGDVLAGTISAFMAWNTILSYDATNQQQQKQRTFACWTACVAVKRATKLAYEKKRRSMGALDVIAEIGSVLDDMEPR